MKSRLIILLFLVLVSAGAIFLILGDRWSTIEDGIDGMILNSSEKIDKIELIGRSDTLMMHKIDSLWQLPDGEVLNNAAIESLLYTASNLRLLSIITSGERSDLRDYITLNFYRGKKISTSFGFFMVGGRVVIYQEGGENAYMVELPGYSDLSVEKVFSLNPNHYREHLLIDLLPNEISSLQISPLKGSGFSVLQDSSAHLQIRDTEGQNLDVEERKIRLLLSYFTAIRFEEYLPREMIPADLKPTSPSAEIQIIDFKGNSYKLNIYQWMKEGEESPDLFRALVLYNNNPQLLVVNYMHLDLLIRSAEIYLPGE